MDESSTGREHQPNNIAQSQSHSRSSSHRPSAKRDRQTTLEFTPVQSIHSANTTAAAAAAATPTESKRRKLGTNTESESMEIDQGNMSTYTNAVSSTAASSSSSSLAPRRRAHSPVSKKKMVIKPFKVKPQLAASFEEDTQSKLTQAVEAVYQKKAIDMSQEELYRAVEALCIHNKAPMLYEKLVSQCQAHITQLIQSLASQLASTHPESSSSSSIPSSADSLSSPIAAAAISSPSSSFAMSSTISLPFLQHVQSVWSAHCEEMITIRGIFLYLDRTYVIQLANSNSNTSMMDTQGNGSNLNSSSTSTPHKSLWDMGLSLFCSELKRHSSVEEKVIAGLLGLIERERHGESINRPLVKALLRMFSALKLYPTSFQARFIGGTTSFYQAESKRMIDTSTPVEYIQYIQLRLHQEEERATAYLDEMTRTPLMKLMQELLISTHANHLLAGGFKQLLDTKRSTELGAMYKLFEKVGKLDAMKDAFGSYVKATATEIVQSGSAESAEKPAPDTSTAASSSSSSSTTVPTSAPPPTGPSSQATMIIDLLTLKVTLDQLLAFSFAGNSDFVYSMKLAFEHALNSVENKPAELIAKFFDKILKTGGRGIKIGGIHTVSATDTGVSASSSVSGGDDVESLLDQAMFLFRYIHGKDVFQAFFKKDLAKRLLLHKSASIDSEKSMISKIKTECGASFTTKLEGMFKDMDLSRETQIEYDQHRQEQLKNEPPGEVANLPELSVQVLTTGSWPAYTPLDCTLPKEVARMHEDFKLFYLNKHSGRKLIWHHSLATAILRGHFPRGRRELAVSGVQAIVLMLFNEHQRLTMEEIGKYSGITDGMELKRTLASLTFAEDAKLLLKEPRNKKLSPADVFTVNTDFSHKLFRVKINSVQLKETKEEQKSTTTRVFEDRQYALDAAIVRIMKARKTLSHQLLVMEVIQQIKFPTKPADIKKRIASLIEREYMERDKNDSAVRQQRKKGLAAAREIGYGLFLRSRNILASYLFSL